MKKMTYSFSAFLLIVLGSCYGDPDLDGLSYDLVVATDRDLQTEFSEFATYHISDTIPLITDDKNDSIWVGADALAIVNKIKENLNAYGYTFVERDENPDLGLIPALLNTSNVSSSCTGWWGGYPGYWDPWWWGYPGYGYYYPFCGYYSYETGTLSIDVIDLKNTGESENLDAVWTGLLFGVLNDNNATNIDRAFRAIDQAFVQSPYLKK